MKAPSCTVLLVEDDENDRFFFELAFKALVSNATLHCVPNGMEALRYIQGEGEYADRVRYPFPTKLITDLKMPSCDGFELLRALRANEHWSIIPVIVLSASADTHDIKKSYTLGANAYFIKPSEPQALRDLIRRMHEYWAEAEVPEVDQAGDMLATASHGKLGEPVHS